MSERRNGEPGRIVSGEEWAALCKACGTVTECTPVDLQRYVEGLQDFYASAITREATLRARDVRFAVLLREAAVFLRDEGRITFANDITRALTDRDIEDAR